MPAYRLIALDMDGTLLDDDKTIPQENIAWIRKAADAGVAVCMATGRGRPDILPFMQELGLATPFVAVNGSEVWRKPDALHRRVTMEADIIKKLYELALHYNVWFWGTGTERSFHRHNWPSDIDSQTWLKFGYHTEDAHILAELIEQISAWGTLEVSNSDPNNIELNPLGIHKGNGLLELCEIVGCTPEEAVAVGDSLNDVQMIRTAGLGVAMGNAQEAVKAAADTVTVANGQAGVAEVIRRYVLV